MLSGGEVGFGEGQPREGGDFADIIKGDGWWRGGWRGGLAHGGVYEVGCAESG